MSVSRSAYGNYDVDGTLGTMFPASRIYSKSANVAVTKTLGSLAVTFADIRLSYIGTLLGFSPAGLSNICNNGLINKWSNFGVYEHDLSGTYPIATLKSEFNMNDFAGYNHNALKPGLGGDSWVDADYTYLPIDNSTTTETFSLDIILGDIDWSPLGNVNWVKVTSILNGETVTEFIPFTDFTVDDTGAYKLDHAMGYKVSRLITLDLMEITAELIYSSGDPETDGYTSLLSLVSVYEISVQVNTVPYVDVQEDLGTYYVDYAVDEPFFYEDGQWGIAYFGIKNSSGTYVLCAADITITYYEYLGGGEYSATELYSEYQDGVFSDPMQNSITGDLATDIPDGSYMVISLSNITVY